MKCVKVSDNGDCPEVPFDKKVDGETCKPGCPRWAAVSAINRLGETIQCMAIDGIGR